MSEKKPSAADLAKRLDECLAERLAELFADVDPRLAELGSRDEAWGFHDTARATYSGVMEGDRVGEVMLGIYCRDGGAVLEFSCRFLDLGQGRKALKMGIFSDTAEELADEGHPERARFFMEVMRRATDLDDREIMMAFLRAAGCLDLTSYDYSRGDAERFDKAVAKRDAERAERERRAIEKAVGSQADGAPRKGPAAARL